MWRQALEESFCFLSSGQRMLEGTCMWKGNAPIDRSQPDASKVFVQLIDVRPGDQPTLPDEIDPLPILDMKLIEQLDLWKNSQIHKRYFF